MTDYESNDLEGEEEQNYENNIKNEENNENMMMSSNNDINNNNMQNNNEEEEQQDNENEENENYNNNETENNNDNDNDNNNKNTENNNNINTNTGNDENPEILYEQFFNYFLPNKKNTLSIKECKNAMRCLGLVVTEKEIQNFLEIKKKTGKEKINLEEFKYICKKKLTESGNNKTE